MSRPTNSKELYLATGETTLGVVAAACVLDITNILGDRDGSFRKVLHVVVLLHDKIEQKTEKTNKQ